MAKAVTGRLRTYLKTVSIKQTSLLASSIIALLGIFLMISAPFLELALALKLGLHNPDPYWNAYKIISPWTKYLSWLILILGTANLYVASRINPKSVISVVAAIISFVVALKFALTYS